MTYYRITMNEASVRTGTQILESIEQVLLSQRMPAPTYNDRKKESDKTNELYKALHAAQKNFADVSKTGTGARGQKYAKIDDLVSASRNALHAQNLVVHTRKVFEGGFTVLVTRLAHWPSDQFVESELVLLNNEDEQKRGSSITYAWRYSYAPLIGLVDNSCDDDGEASTTIAYRK